MMDVFASGLKQIHVKKNNNNRETEKGVHVNFASDPM